MSDLTVAITLTPTWEQGLYSDMQRLAVVGWAAEAWDSGEWGVWNPAGDLVAEGNEADADAARYAATRAIENHANRAMAVA